jgi:hypothetical protein
MLGLANASDVGAAACACADPVVAGLVGDLLKSAPLEDLLAAARLVVSVQIAAYKPTA